jgi:hypothetical protein
MAEHVNAPVNHLGHQMKAFRIGKMFQAYIIVTDESTDVKNTASACRVYLWVLLKCSCYINCDI